MEILSILLISVGIISYFLISRAKSDLQKLELERSELMARLRDAESSTFNANDFVRVELYRELSTRTEAIVAKFNEAILANVALQEKNDSLHSKQKSEQVRLGQISEQLVPFLGNFGHDPKKLRPLFSPIDYVCFEEDRITFIEIKTGQSALSQKQKRIKELIENKEVYFEVYRLDGGKDA